SKGKARQFPVCSGKRNAPYSSLKKIVNAALANVNKYCEILEELAGHANYFHDFLTRSCYAKRN
ncbi:MAG TPA: hypothetical protein VKI17_05015, partial [Gemmataceae bacterium]|nr:hypothetical protein [Gemmataceae bacterium]